MKKISGERIYQIFIRVFIGILAFSALIPLLYVIGVSLTTQQELLAKNFFVFFPENPTLEAYKRIFNSPFIWRSLLISAFRSILGPVLMLIVTTVGAYVLSFKDLPFRKFFILAVVSTIVFSGGLIPTYLVYAELHLLNTVWVYIIPGLLDGFSLLIIKIAIETIPVSLTECAEMEGAGYFQRLIYIVVPCIAPTLAAMLLFSVVNHWNSWFDALVYVNEKTLYPFQMIIRNMLESDMASDQMNIFLSDSARIGGESLKMASVIVGMLPIVIVYPFFQKYFVAGTYAGAVKE